MRGVRNAGRRPPSPRIHGPGYRRADPHGRAAAPAPPPAHHPAPGRGRGPPGPPKSPSRSIRQHRGVRQGVGESRSWTHRAPEAGCGRAGRPELPVAARRSAGVPDRGRRCCRLVGQEARRPGNRGRGGISFHRRAAVRGHERHEGSGLFRRWSRRGDPEWTQPAQEPSGGVADLLVQTSRRRHADHRYPAGSGACPRGQRAPPGRRGPDYRPAHRGQGRLPPLVGDLRPAHEGHFRHSG